jgi:two-component system sensor histidine kinase VicK
LLDDVGESFENNGDIDSAQLYYSKALVYINKNNTRYQEHAAMLDVARAVVYGNQGKIAFTYGQYQQAKDLLKKSIDINLQPFNDNYNAELVEITLGQLYLDNHKYNDFISLSQNMRQQLVKVKNIEAETAWNKLMVNYYTQKKDFASAFAYFNNYSSLKDSLSKQANSLKETDVKQQWANYDKQYQIEGLKGDNKLQLLYLYVAIICVSMAVIIIFLVYRNWNRSKNDVLAVSELNKQINQQNISLETTFEELKTNSQEKDRILHTVAHDLRNPIGGIVALTNAMIEEDYTREQKQLIGLVNDASQNSLELINEILEATHNTAVELSKEMVDINSLVNNSVEILGFKAAEKDQQIITELLAKPKKLMMSREKIWRVISNLISNAIKFSPNGTTIRLKVTDDKNAIKIAVADNGIGIPDSLKDQVFNKFTNAKRPGTAGEKSFGLGLSICQQIIENHDGKIWFESGGDNGTTFYISLPLG